MRLGAIFIALCMAIIAGSAGAIIYLNLGVSTLEAVTVAVATLTALVLYNTVSSRIGFRSVAGRQLADLSRGGADLARQVAEMGRRLAALEGKIETALDHARAVTDPLTLEIGELGTLVKRLAETVAGHQTTLEALARTSSKSQEIPASEMPTQPPATAIPTADQPPPSSDLAGKDGAVTAGSVDLPLAAIRDAIDSNRIDLYLQPIVTLPHRKIRYYEAMSRLRNEAGETLHASDFVPPAESSGLMPRIDDLVIFRCVQLVRRLLLKNREIGLFCNLSQTTLTDASCFPQFLDFMAANRAIAPALVFQFTHSAVRAMGAIEHENLAALSEHGFRFSIDHVTGLRLEPGELADRGFRYIKVNANLLLNTARLAPTDIHPADLSDLLGRFGIDLIVDRIEHERSVIDLLDYDVRYGQGSLFSPPRPVRAEALQANPELPDAATGERSAGANQLMPTTSPARNANPSMPETDNAGPSTVAQIARGVTGRG
jgi:cyclic-di-GMP phosphodiesterase TipF (flagellum assembly factor)